MRTLFLFISITVFLSTSWAIGPAVPGTTPCAVDCGPRPEENELILYSIPAPRKLIWKSPRRLLGTVLSNYAMAHQGKGGSHLIGHVFVGLKVDGREILAGMTTGGDFEEMKLLKEKGFALGIIGADMFGRLQSTKELALSIKWLCQNERLGFIRYKLSPALARRLMQYYDEYKELGCDEHYGGFNRPRYGEGGGCSAFGVSFLDVAGLLSEEHYEKWTVDVNIPAHLYGGPYTGKHITTAQMARLGPLATRWADEDEPHVNCFMWEPTYIYLWIHRLWEQGNKGRIATESYGCAIGITIDASQKPLPQESIWKDPIKEPNPYGWQPGIHWGSTEEKLED